MVRSPKGRGVGRLRRSQFLSARSAFRDVLVNAPFYHMLSKRFGISISHNSRLKHCDYNHENNEKSKGTQEQKELGKSHELSVLCLCAAGMRREG